MEGILQKLIQTIFIPKAERAEKKIGYQLFFRSIPDCFLNGVVRWDETTTWKKFGLDLEVGVNYWTIGRLMNGVSSRFDSGAPEYQSWLGGYLVKLASNRPWTVEDHFKLAIADQNSWLKTYGDPRPITSIEGWAFNQIDKIQIGKYSGRLYEGGCTTHSDIGGGYKKIKPRIISCGIAALFNSLNPNLFLRGNQLRPNTANDSYKTLKLRGYIAIFDIAENRKIVLYGNGVVDEEMDMDTFRY